MLVYIYYALYIYTIPLNTPILQKRHQKRSRQKPKVEAKGLYLSHGPKRRLWLAALRTEVGQQGTRGKQFLLKLPSRTHQPGILPPPPPAALPGQDGLISAPRASPGCPEDTIGLCHGTGTR